jgi:DNA replication protein DnaC
MGRKARRRQAPRPASTTELKRLALIPLLVVDEVGYIPFDPEAANLMFMLVSSPLRARLADRHSATSRSAPGARSSATTPSPSR